MVALAQLEDVHSGPYGWGVSPDFLSNSSGSTTPDVLPASAKTAAGSVLTSILRAVSVFAVSLWFAGFKVV